MDTTTESTPAPSADTSSAAPAISAPSSAEATSQRPATALEAFAQVTADPSTATDPAAIAQVETGAPAPTDKKGPIPFDVHSKALDNARTKASEEALAKHREQFGWAETVDRSAVEQMQKLGQLYTADRGGYVKQLLAESIADPQLAPIVRSEIARILGSSRQAAAPSFEPDIPVYDGQGVLVNQTFSAEKVRELITHSVAEALGKEIGPIKQDFEARQATAAETEKQAAFDRELDAIWNKNIELPHFAEYQNEIGKVFAAMPLFEIRDGKKVPISPDQALQKSWNQVVGSQLEAKAQAKALDTFKTKAAAQTVDGSGKAASTPKRPRTPAELAAYMRQMAT